MTSHSRTAKGGILTALAAAGLAGLTGPALAACTGQISYRIGDVDPRFGVTRAQVRAAVSDAEAVWETATGRDLFVHDPESPLAIGFVYDERQETQDFLTAKNARQKTILAEYDKLIETLDAERRSYEAARQTLENRLRAHNREVSYWNEQGGAPTREYRRIQTTAGRLRGEREQLLERNRTLNAFVKQINELAARHNQASSHYNRSIERLNERYDDSILVGEFSGDRIQVFSFANGLHLRLVLAHELGHALALGHVDDPTAIMHFKTGPKGQSLALSKADLAELARVCGEG